MRRIATLLAAPAIVVALTASVAPNTAYAKHGHGAGVALGIIGGVLAGAAIASSQPAYAAPSAYYDQPYGYYGYTAPQAYYRSPGYYGYDPSPTYYSYTTVTTYDVPSYYYSPSPSYYSPFGYADYDDQ